MENDRTFVEVDTESAEKVCEGLSEYDLDGRPIHARVCSAELRPSNRK
jgi:hypothetical protein